MFWRWWRRSERRRNLYLRVKRARDPWFPINRRPLPKEQLAALRRLVESSPSHRAAPSEVDAPDA
jgi:hypothetical protein